MVWKTAWKISIASACATLALGFGCGFVLSGCGHAEEAARAEVDKIAEACRNGQPEQARQLMLKAIESNREFQRAFDRTAAAGTDRARINACGLVLTDLERALRRRR